MTSADQPATNNPGTVELCCCVDRALSAIHNILGRNDAVELRDQKPAACRAAPKPNAARSIRFRFSDSVHEKFWNTKLQHLHCGSFRHRRHDDFSPAVSGDYETVSVCKNQTTCRAPLRNRSMDFLTGILIRWFAGCTAQLIFTVYARCLQWRGLATQIISLHPQVEARTSIRPLHRRIAQRLHTPARGWAPVWPSAASEFSSFSHLAGLS
jgi:hypothetical protein